MTRESKTTARATPGASAREQRSRAAPGVYIGNRSMGRLLARAAGGEIPGADHARRAVAGAVPGRFPFADRIGRETGGAVDARKVPTAVVPGLSARGVAFGGRIALRPDAGIEVARHELSHVFGADEHTARRAERDPSILAGMTRSAPRDGWDRDPKFNYLRLYIEDIYVDVPYDPKKTTSGEYVESISEEATERVRSILSRAEIWAVDWKVFQLNVRGWVQRGFDGMFPLFDAFAGKDDGELIVDEAHDEGSIGQENEIRKAIIQGEGLKYDATLAQTKAVSSKVSVDKHGRVKRIDSRWPLMRVSADQVKPVVVKKKKKVESSSSGKSSAPKKKGPPPPVGRAMTFSPDMFKKTLRSSKKKARRPRPRRAPKRSLGGLKRGVIELIFGPISSGDREASQRRAKATNLFIKTVRFGWGEGGLPFEDFVGAFNSEISLAAFDDPGMADYAVGDVKSGILIGCETLDKAEQKRRGAPPSMLDMGQSIQTSVEVSAVKLGDIEDESYLALWDDARPNEKRDKQVFQAARVEANAYVDRFLRPRVAALSGGVYDGRKLDLARLNAVFTLALFQIAKASDTLTKAASPVMEKAGFGDQMREILDARDKAALWDLIKPKKMGALISETFEVTMLEAAERVWKVKDRLGHGLSEVSHQSFKPKKGDVRKRLLLFATTTETVKGRYGSTFGRRDDDPRYGKKEEEVESGRLGMKWDFRGRQRVYGKDPTQKGGTSAGKPIPMTHRIYHGRGLLHRDHRFVVEVRGGDNQINTMHERLHGAPDTVESHEQTSIHDLLAKASKAPELTLPEGPDSMVEPKKHDLKYPDEEQKKPKQFWPIRREPTIESRSEVRTGRRAPVPMAPLPMRAPMPGPRSGHGPRTQSMRTLPTGLDPHSPTLVREAPRRRRPDPRFDNPVVAGFVVGLMMRELAPELPPELADGPMRRRFESGFKRRVLTGAYGAVGTLSQVGNPGFRRLCTEARHLLARLHPPTRRRMAPRSITERTLKGL